MCESDFIIGCGDDGLDSLISSCANFILLGNHVVCHLICAFSRNISLSKFFFVVVDYFVAGRPASRSLT